MIYFDNAATTQIDKAVLDTMIAAMQDTNGNPSSIHAAGRKSRTAIEQARKMIANQLNASIGEIFFTSGGTESNNMAIKCAVRDLGVKRIITTKTEHHCVLHTVQAMELKVDITYLNIDEKARPDLQQLEQLLQDSDSPTLVTLMHANNEVGTMINLQKVSTICKQHNALFHSDTVQTVGYFPIDLDAITMDFMSGSAHKFHGPKGVGFIYINGDNRIKPFIDGGSQERNMRGGTENLHSIIGMSKAIELAYKELPTRKAHIQDLRQYFIAQLKDNFSDIQFNGDYDGLTHYKTVSVSFPNTPRTALMIFNLDIAGIAASGGSACSSGIEAASHVLAAINPIDERQTVRFSFSHHNTKEEIDTLIGVLRTILAEKVKVNS